MENFTRSFPHGNPMGYETETTVLQDRRWQAAGALTPNLTSQHLINSSMARSLPVPQISRKSTHNFLGSRAHKQTDTGQAL